MFKGTVVETITPAKAKALLTRNPTNRRITEGTLADYTRDMRNGRWELNGETLKIAEDGTLIDGQHRLLACVAADLPFKTYIAYSVEKSTFDTIDIGRKRTNGDMLSMDGVANATATAAAIRWVNAYKTNKGSPNNITLSSRDIREKYAEDPQAFDYATTRGRTAVSGLAPPAIGAAMFYLMGKKSISQTEHFFEALHTGAGLSGGSPILALRNRLLNSKSGRARLLPLEVAIIMTRAWNAFRNNTALAVLVGSRKMGEDSIVTMPAIK